MNFTERETFLTSLSHQQLLSEVLRLDAMLTAEARMVRELQAKWTKP